MTNPTPPNSNRVPLFPRATPAYPLPRQPTPSGVLLQDIAGGSQLQPNPNNLALDYYSYANAGGGFIAHVSNFFQGDPSIKGYLNIYHKDSNGLLPYSQAEPFSFENARFSYGRFVLMTLVDPLIGAAASAQATESAVEDNPTNPTQGRGVSSNRQFAGGIVRNDRTGQQLHIGASAGSLRYTIGDRGATVPDYQQGVAAWWLDWLRIQSIDALPVGSTANIFIDAYNGYVTTVANAYDAQVRTINSNPAVIDPYTTLTALVGQQVPVIVGLVTGAVATITALAQSALNTVNQLKTGTVDPAVAQADAEVKRQQAFATATLNSLLAQIDSATKGALATVEQQRQIIDAEVKRQQANAEATVNATITQAMAQIASATATILGLVGTVTTIAGQQVTFVLNTLLGVLANVQAQAADRPLFYGALSSPVTITSPTDVVVIPAGGLTVTAD